MKMIERIGYFALGCIATVSALAFAKTQNEQLIPPQRAEATSAKTCAGCAHIEDCTLKDVFECGMDKRNYERKADDGTSEMQ